VAGESTAGEHAGCLGPFTRSRMDHRFPCAVDHRQASHWDRGVHVQIRRTAVFTRSISFSSCTPVLSCLARVRPRIRLPCLDPADLFVLGGYAHMLFFHKAIGQHQLGIRHWHSASENLPWPLLSVTHACRPDLHLPAHALFPRRGHAKTICELNKLSGRATHCSGS
jgi:hypothetical protein